MTLNAELLRLASNAGLRRLASEVFILLETRGPRFSSKRDLRVEVRFASDDLPLMIFKHLTIGSSAWTGTVSLAIILTDSVNDNDKKREYQDILEKHLEGG